MSKTNMQIINLTPHAIRLLGNDSVLIPSAGKVARCSINRERLGMININGVRVPLLKNTLGKVYGLPRPEVGRLYIVSSVVAQACSEREDLLIVDGVIRRNGYIRGARALAKIS